MNLSYSIDVYEHGRAGLLYSVTFSDEDVCEFDRFLADAECRACPEFNDTVAFVDYMVREGSFDPRFFKRDGYLYTMGYLKWPRRGKRQQVLRLYFSIWRDWIAIVGAGCVKPTDGRLDQYPSCARSHDRLRAVVRDLEEKRVKKLITFTRSGIESDDPLTGEITI